MKLYEQKIFGEERALYGIEQAQVKSCVFDGPQDGESALKECRDLWIEDCDFRLRYPLWHVRNVDIRSSRMAETCRAALWYDEDIRLENCVLGGIKALRECRGITLERSEAISPEFGWFCQNVKAVDFTVTSEYAFLQSSKMEFERLRLTGKYSFQYVEDMVIRNSYLETKDAFWHTKNVTVYDSVLKGEYLAWYCEKLTLVRCKIIGTQPLCYCKDLVLEDCEMLETDLAFENSHVQATVKGPILSVKNPLSGRISAGSIGEIIVEAYARENGGCEIICEDR